MKRENEAAGMLYKCGPVMLGPVSLVEGSRSPPLLHHLLGVLLPSDPEVHAVKGGQDE